MVGKVYLVYAQKDGPLQQGAPHTQLWETLPAPQAELGIPPCAGMVPGMWCHCHTPQLPLRQHWGFDKLLHLLSLQLASTSDSVAHVNTQAPQPQDFSLSSMLCHTFHLQSPTPANIDEKL